MKIGIVGADATRLSENAYLDARKTIALILKSHKEPVLVSGHSPKGGIDLLAEEIADGLFIRKEIKKPTHDHWNCTDPSCYGYRARNIDIAQVSDIVYNLAVKDEGAYCYHCNKTGHRKNGGCYTMKKAISLGKEGNLFLI